MSYFRKLETKLTHLLELLDRAERWLIVINADPDAMASALALKRIMIHRVDDVAIARVNEITRPDNLAMARYLRIPMVKLTPTLAAQFDRFAVVDSQPHHHPSFKDLHFSLVIDHHPLSEEHPVVADFKEIRNDYGATSTVMTEYLYNLGIRPGKLLATALQFGIKTDTASFERAFCDVDMRAYRYLSKFADHALLSRIVRSEFRLHWLDYFSRAFISMHKLGTGQYVYVGEVENPDILVVIADFFMRVHEIRWAAVCGVYGDTIVVILRGDGMGRDLGRYANLQFGDVGSAGGHRAMARAEIPLSTAEGRNVEFFIYKRLLAPRKRAKVKPEAKPDAKADAKAMDKPDVKPDAKAAPQSAQKTPGKALPAGTAAAPAAAPAGAPGVPGVSDAPVAAVTPAAPVPVVTGTK
ncbi:MAG TPA: phosphoesterase [Desulfovibrio sp.]|jgi:nanoRNase/pAp phosphatase (c-di-AMP/oligoRNAs hydrolase)|nr:phosphoesterase [Desulfovibrio sp.]